MTAWTLVTGGAKGLGASICLHLAQAGSAVVVHYCKSQQDAESLIQKCRACGVAAETCYGDFSTSETVESFLKEYTQRFSDTCALVNNVGNFCLGAASATPIDQWQALFQSNLYAPIALIQGLLPSLRRHQGGIVNMGLAGVERQFADTYCAAYSTAKAALWQVTRSLARELASEHVRVNMVSPGYLESSVVMPSGGYIFPMGRAAALQEVADVVGYLLRNSNQYITGQNIEVAGGVRL